MFCARIAAKRIAFKHSVELSSTTINLRITGLHSMRIMPGAAPARNVKLRRRLNNMDSGPQGVRGPQTQSFRPAPQRQINVLAQHANDVVGFLQDRSGQCPATLSTPGQDPVNLIRLLHEARHFAGNRSQL